MLQLKNVYIYIYLMKIQSSHQIQAAQLEDHESLDLMYCPLSKKRMRNQLFLEQEVKTINTQKPQKLFTDQAMFGILKSKRYNMKKSLFFYCSTRNSNIFSVFLKNIPTSHFFYLHFKILINLSCYLFFCPKSNICFSLMMHYGV